MAGGGQGSGTGSQSQNGIGNMTNTKIPQWMQGLQMGQQIAQLGARPQAPQGAGFQPHPMGGMGAPAGMPQGGVVPGAQGAAPPIPSGPPGMASGSMGMPQAPGMTNTGQQQISPQIMQLMRQRGLM